MLGDTTPWRAVPTIVRMKKSPNAKCTKSLLEYFPIVPSVAGKINHRVSAGFSVPEAADAANWQWRTLIQIRDFGPYI